MIAIRQACLEDLVAILGIVKDATRHMDAQGIAQWDDIYPSKAILEHDIENQQMHLIEVEGHVAGLIVSNEDQSPEYVDVAWRFSGRVLVVHRLTIHPSYKRRGLATRLMDYVEEAADRQSYDCIRLDAFTKNPGASSLYENRGYRRAGLVLFRKGEFFCYEKQIRPGGTKESSNNAIQRIFNAPR